MTEQELMNMELHDDSLVLDDDDGNYVNVIRVIGGWIYTNIIHDDGHNLTQTSTFVPEPKKD